MQAYAVVIPAFNATRTVAETLASVLAQTVPPAEVSATVRVALKAGITTA